MSRETLRVYHFVGPQHGLENIRRRRIKISTIEDLNDPFDINSFVFTNPADRRAWGSFREDLTLSYGMCCFSRVWSDPVQWSHYAEKHKGLCLGFDIPTHLAVNVIYRNTRPKINDIFNINEDQFLRMSSIKYKRWEYEREVRIFASLDERDADSGLYFKDFDENLVLRQVIVGHRCLVHRAELRDALVAAGIEARAFRARLAFQTYKVVRQRDEALWV